METGNWRKKYLLALMTSPITLFPLAGGATALMVLGALSVQSPLPWVGAIGSMVFGVGVFIQRLAIGSPSVAKKVQEEAEQEVVNAREAELDELQTQLEGDEDQRTDTLLADLRVLLKVYKEGDSWRSGIDVSAMEFLFTANQVFEECVLKLRRTLELYLNARAASNRRVKKTFLDEREKEIKEVQASLDALNSTLQELRNLKSSQDQRCKLAELRQDLLDNLELARRTNARRDELLGGIGISKELQ